jgi:ketosteroid isomerase-like protein
MRSIAAILVAAAFACGGPSHTPPTTTAATTPAAALPTLSDPDLQPLAFLVGSWRAEDGTTEIWTAAGDALFGVAFGGSSFEAAIISSDGAQITYRAMPGGRPAVPFVLDKATLAAGNARFTNPDHDDPQVIHYTRTGDTLQASVGTLDAAKPLTLAFTRFEHTPAPALADADRQFAADTSRDGAQGWTPWFAPEGWMLRKDEKVVGHAAIAELMAPLLDDPHQKLLWEPVTSGFAATGDVGFTVGEAHIVSSGKVVWYGAYVTIWKKQPDGAWRVLFDTGDDDSRRSRDS